MKRIRNLIFALLMSFTVALTIGGNATAAKNVTVSLPKFDVVINGQLIRDYYQEELQYPFYVYKDITYFPMTYFDCNTLGVYNYWTPETGNMITSGMPCTEYTEVLAASTRSETAIAQIAETKISVNGTQINNSQEEYPILLCNNVLYFPMTWRWITEFGWESNFAHSTFSIYTSDCQYKNLVYGYSLKDLKRTYIPLSSLHAGKSAGVCFAVKAANISFDGYTKLYAETFTNEKKPRTRCVVVPDHMFSLYVENGWKTFQEYWSNNTHHLWYISNKEYYSGISYFDIYVDDVVYQESPLTCYSIIRNKKQQIGKNGYAQTATPLIVDDFYFLYDSDDNGTKDELTIYFANLTDKTITDIKLTWDCYDMFDDPITETFYNDYGKLVTKEGSETFSALGGDLHISPYSTTWATWDVSSYSRIDKVKNIKIEKVIFADGTIWEA